jgi:NAD-dependent deacetylase
MSKKRIVVLTGAGVSAESGLKTFRDTDGLWEGYKIEEVATLNAWHTNMESVLEFYNLRRKNVLEATPNKAHFLIKKLEENFDVNIITQNIDNLHEKAGSTNVLHLHGLITEVKSTVDDNLIYPLDGWELKIGDKCEYGFQLRPNIVWFGEPVPNIEPAIKLVQQADIMIVTGTSLQVYPAAGLLQYFDPNKMLYVIDPKSVPVSRNNHVKMIQLKASEGMEQLCQLIM